MKLFRPQPHGARDSQLYSTDNEPSASSVVPNTHKHSDGQEIHRKTLIFLREQNGSSWPDSPPPLNATHISRSLFVRQLHVYWLSRLINMEHGASSSRCHQVSISCIVFTLDSIYPSPSLFCKISLFSPPHRLFQGHRCRIRFKTFGGYKIYTSFSNKYFQ
jgi:hypothetical protein